MALCVSEIKKVTEVFIDNMFLPIPFQHYEMEPEAPSVILLRSAQNRDAFV